MNRLASVALALALLVAPASGGAGEGFQVIVNGQNPVSSVSRDLLSRIFLKKVQKWDNGWPATPVDQDQASSVRAAFSKAVHGKPVTAVSSYWQRQIFAGNDVPPAEKADDAAVIAFVRASPGAIGYVSGNVPPDVKVVAVE